MRHSTELRSSNCLFRIFGYMYELGCIVSDLLCCCFLNLWRAELAGRRHGMQSRIFVRAGISMQAEWSWGSHPAKAAAKLRSGKIIDRITAARGSRPQPDRALAHYLMQIAKLGGYLARAHDPPLATSSPGEDGRASPTSKLASA